MNVLDLFSGIGGFSLGLERAGMRTVAFCEIDPFCRRVLAKHWPGVPVYDDVRSLTADRLRADGISVDLVCGGFPCQDISFAGAGAGIAGARSGLWAEYARLIGELRPRYVIVENVSALLGRGLDVVLGDLATLRYDAEWHCIRAADVGAPHLRDRIWIVAYPQHPDANGERSHRANLHKHGSAEFRHQQIRVSRSLGEALADAYGDGWPARQQAAAAVGHGRSAGADGGAVSDAIGKRVHIEPLAVAERSGSLLADGHGAIREMADADGQLCDRPRIGTAAERFAEPADAGWWSVEPDVGRVAHGVPSRVDRLKGLGNAVVPQIPEIIGRAIMNVEASQ